MGALQGLSYTNTNLIHEGSASRLKHVLKAPPPNTITLGLHFSIRILDKQPTATLCCDLYHKLTSTDVYVSRASVPFPSLLSFSYAITTVS